MVIATSSALGAGAAGAAAMTLRDAGSTIAAHAKTAITGDRALRFGMPARLEVKNCETFRVIYGLPMHDTQMDAAFIQQNQIVERYLAGKLPPKGASDFERYCRDNPTTLIELGMADRINAALRLLDASGQPEPWAEKKIPFYQKPFVIAAVAALAGTFLIATLMLLTDGQKKDEQIAVLSKDLKTQPLQPSTSTRPIVVQLSRTGPATSSAVVIGGKDTELADFKFDVSWSSFTNFRVIFDRVDQGRVAVLTNLVRDSNGHLRIALNSSALGPGDYDVTFEGMDWRGNPSAQAWTRFGVAR